MVAETVREITSGLQNLLFCDCPVISEAWELLPVFNLIRPAKRPAKCLGRA